MYYPARTYLTHLRMNKLLFTTLSLLIATYGCSHEKSDKIQKNRDNILNVKSEVKELLINEILLNNNCELCFIDNYLLIKDSKSYDKQIYLLDRYSLKYIAGTAPKGQGPGEIANIGHVEVDEQNKCFWVTDFGKNKIFRYELDSVLLNPSYMPETGISFKEAQIPADYFLINDSLFMTTVIMPTGDYGYNQLVAKFNMKTGEIMPMQNLHPEIERMRVSIEISKEYGIYVECYQHHDLICIRTLDGDLKYNVYGRYWNTETSNKKSYFNDPVFIHDKICMNYSGEDTFIKEKNGEPAYNWPTKLVFFDLNGNYLKTLDIGYRVCSYIWDNRNNRLLFSFNDDIQFAYLNLNGII